MVVVEKREAVAPPSKHDSDQFLDEWCSENPGADVRIVTSGGRSIPAHSSVLASVSPVMENISLDLSRKRGSGEKVIPILGVPCNAVVAFVRSLYSSRCPGEVEMEKYGVHLLVLSHVMRVAWLKRAVAGGLAATVVVDNVVDLLQLARQCDAPRLYVRCMNIVRREFKQVEQTEGWKFVQNHDPWLELEVLQFLQEADKREKRRMRMKREQGVYMELNEAMECLQHICTEGCTGVGPREEEVPRRGPCGFGRTCEALQQLIRHFATCERKKQRVPGGGCGRCGRMWQLLRLHSAICDQPEPCKVPLCMQFKERMGATAKKGEDERWRLLARKVLSAKVVSTLSKRKREEDVHKSWTSQI